jgi:hypothetical protein
MLLTSVEDMSYQPGHSAYILGLMELDPDPRVQGMKSKDDPDVRIQAGRSVSYGTEDSPRKR